MKIDARILHITALALALGCGDSTGETADGSSSGDSTAGPTTAPTTAPTTIDPSESSSSTTASTSLDSTGSTTEAQSPEIAVSIDGRAIDSGGTYDIGDSVDVGAMGTEITVTIDNLGTADLAVASVALDTGATTHFALDDAGLDAVVAPGASTSVTVAFAPINGGDKEVLLLIDNDDADEGAYAVTLRAGTTPNTYRDLEPTASPSARFNTAMVATDDGRVLLFGGRQSDGFRRFDTWVFDIEAGDWTELLPTSSPPFRDAHAMAYVGGGMVVMFGGNQTSGPAGNVTPLGDSWVFDMATEEWTELLPALSPPARFQHAMVAAGDGTAILYGGRPDFGLELSDTWVLDLATETWTDLAPPTNPGPRSAFAMASNASDTVFMVGGSIDSMAVVDETWTYDVMANDWTQGAATGAGGLFSHPAVWLEDGGFITFSGKADCCSEPLAGTWAYDAGLDTWADLAPALEPAPRFSHAMIAVGGNKAILFGGLLVNGGPGSAVAETWEYVGALGS